MRGSENTDRPLAAGGRPSALRPSQQRRAHLQGLPHGPRQRGQRWPVAAPSPTLFFSCPRRREASRPGRRKTAPQLSPRAPRLPHPPLPAAATAPSGVSTVAAGVWGVAGGRGGRRPLLRCELAVSTRGPERDSCVPLFVPFWLSSAGFYPCSSPPSLLFLSGK